METKDVQLAVGRRIQELRRSKKLTQQGVADAMGMEVSNYARIEGGRANVTLDSLVRIANALDTPILSLFKAPKSLEVPKGRPRRRPTKSPIQIVRRESRRT